MIKYAAGVCLLALIGSGLAIADAFAETPTQVPVEEDYLLHCSACHGAAGVGVSGIVPSLADVGELFVRPGGRAYLARVPGVAQAPLSNARIARLLDWVLLTYGGVTAEPGYAADEVGDLRRRPLRDPGAERAAIMTDAATASQDTLGDESSRRSD
jgi:hypothetical protein